MANSIVVKNTLAFLFPGNATQPTLEDMGRFIKTLKGDRSMMDTGYKISDEKSVFVRFKSEDAMMFSFENNPATLPFRYTDGRKVMVSMSVAGGNTRYVRVYDLPPEATDPDLSAVLGKYGVIKRIVRERFPAEIGLDMYSGVRGLYMDIQRDIPEVLHFRGRKGRISYEGIKLKCYVCKSNEHLKKACPVFKARRIEETNQQEEEQCHLQISPCSVEAGTGEAAAPVTGEQRSKSENQTAPKHQLSPDSDTINSQPKSKKKVCVQSDGDHVRDGPQSNSGNSSESDTDIEPIDWTTSSLEKQQEWIEKNNRHTRRLQRKAQRILARAGL